MTKQRKITHIINSEADVPSHFDSEADEAAFWDSADFTMEFFRTAERVPDGVLPPVRGRTRPVTIRFDADVMRRLKVLAREKGKGYQTLLKQFVTERLYEEEVREGLIRKGARARARPIARRGPARQPA